MQHSGSKKRNIDFFCKCDAVGTILDDIDWVLTDPSFIALTNKSSKLEISTMSHKTLPKVHELPQHLENPRVTDMLSNLFEKEDIYDYTPFILNHEEGKVRYIETHLQEGDSEEEALAWRTLGSYCFNSIRKTEVSKKVFNTIESMINPVKGSVIEYSKTSENTKDPAKAAEMIILKHRNQLDGYHYICLPLFRGGICTHNIVIVCNKDDLEKIELNWRYFYFEMKNPSLES